MPTGAYSIDTRTNTGPFRILRALPLVYLGLFCLAAWAWASAPAGLFTIDEFFYEQMARAMEQEGALNYRQIQLDGAEAIDMLVAHPVGKGRLSPQYPSGYAILAAPFYAAFGVKGLMLLNLFAGGFVAAMTYRLALDLSGDRVKAHLAVGVLLTGTFFSTYALAVWPHLLSAAFVLAAVLAAERSDRQHVSIAILSGLLVGLGQSIRIDMIVLAPAIIVWMRVFAENRSRLSAINFVAGLAAGLAASATINLLKSGIFNPFTYRNEIEINDPAIYAGLGAAAGLFVCVLILVDARRVWLAAVATVTRRPRLFLMAGALAAVLLFAPIAALVRGAWYALIDAQSYQFLDRQVGIERNSAGWLVFYGVNKKALLQSLPYLALLAPPLLRLTRGGAARAEWLLWAVIGAFVTLYSYNQIDSGLAFNARFLIPVLPFVAILCAFALADLARSVDIAPLTGVLTFAACVLGAAWVRLVGLGAGAEAPMFDLYPQLFIACAALAAIVWASGSDKPAPQRAAFLAAVAALGYAVTINADDALRSQHVRNRIAVESSRLVGAAPGDSLVLTSRPMVFSGPAWAGASIAYPGIAADEATITLVEEFWAAGRCVFVYGDAAVEWVDRVGLSGQGGVKRALPAGDGGGLVIGADARCRRN